MVISNIKNAPVKAGVVLTGCILALLTHEVIGMPATDEQAYETTAGGDYYPSLDALKKELVSGKDYQILTVDRKSWVTIVAPHGGSIEPGTSKLATHLADNGKYNLFDFQALSRDNARRLHVTSTHYRDADLTHLLDESETAVSIHGMRDNKPDDMTIFVGGLNAKLRDRIASALTSAGFEVNTEAPRLGGTSKENFVNLPRDGGVQLELPHSLRKAMDASTGTDSQSDKFLSALQTALHEYHHSAQ